MKLIKKIKNCVKLGLIIIIPLYVVLYILYCFLRLLNYSIIFIPEEYRYFKYIGVFLSFTLILFSGLIFNNFLGRKVISLYEFFMDKIPIIRSIYYGIKKVSEKIFMHENKEFFDNVVLVKFPNKDTLSLAFVTNNSISNLILKSGKASLQNKLILFIPTTPNPTSGFLIIAKKSDVIEVDMSIETALAFIMSLGVINENDK